MNITLTPAKALREEIASPAEDFLAALNTATENVLANVLPVGVEVPVPISEPDWNSSDAIQTYLQSLRSQGDDIRKGLTHAKSNLPDVEKVNEEVRRLLQEAVILINKKRMEIQQNVRDIEAIARHNNDLTEKANRRLAELWEQKANLERLAALEGTVKELCEDFNAWHQARNYQVDSILTAVSAYIQGKSGFLDADDMGLGKTFKSAVMMFIIRALFMNEHGREPKMIWITKKSLIKSNMKEIQKWYPEHKIVPCLPDHAKSLKDRELIFQISQMTESMFLCSYEHVRTTEIVKFTKWDVVFVDEVHKLKGGCNPKPTEIWNTMKEVCRQARFMYFLSGTPIVNKAEEMWSYLHLFAPETFPSVRNFLHKFTDSTWGDDGNVTFKVNVNRLLNALEGQMIHRSKHEVAADLPDMDADFIYLEMEGEQLKYYEQMRDHFFVMLEKGGDKTMLSANVIIAHLNRLRQIALAPRSLKLIDKETGETWQLPDTVNSAKLDHAMDLIEGIDDQVVVFSSQYNAPLEELQERLTAAGKTWRVIDGEHSRYSQEYENDFQQAKFDVLLINMRTGTEGLNLQKCADWPGGASYAIMLDLWWNPAMNEQAMDRLHRMNTSEPVMIYVLQCEDSVDAYVKAIIQKKEGLISPLMNDSRLRPASEWRELLEGLV